MQSQKQLIQKKAEKKHKEQMGQVGTKIARYRITKRNI